MHADNLMQLLQWSSGKIYLNDEVYQQMRDEHGMRGHQVDGAIDYLFAAGSIDINVSAGEIITLYLPGREDWGRQ